MIFNEDYDRSLWLILSGNKNNRERIANFIKEIPEELYKQIRKSLLRYREYLNKNRGILVCDREPIEFSGEFETAGDMLYWYSIDAVTGELEIGKGIKVEKEVLDVFQLTLYPLTKRQYRKMTTLNDYLLGEIIFNYTEEEINGEICLVDSDSAEFKLITLPFDKTIVKSFESFPYMRDRFGFVDVKSSSQDYSISDLSNKDRLNRLVRSKRDRKKYRDR